MVGRSVGFLKIFDDCHGRLFGLLVDDDDWEPKRGYFDGDSIRFLAMTAILFDLRSF